MNSFKGIKNSLLLLFIVISIAITYHYINKYNRGIKIKKCKNTWAIYEGKVNTIGMTNSIFYFYNEKNIKKHVRINYHNPNLYLNKGDTVIIKYSIIDNSIAEVVNSSLNDNLRIKYSIEDSSPR
jgi:hypothetical protein